MIQVLELVAQLQKAYERVKRYSCHPWNVRLTPAQESFYIEFSGRTVRANKGPMRTDGRWQLVDSIDTPTGDPIIVSRHPEHARHARRIRDLWL